jgi:hypothetical protein
MTQRVNTCMNANAGCDAVKGDKLVTRLRRDSALDFVAGKQSKVEQRRVLWTTHGNVDLWFDTLETSLVQLGFGRLKTEADSSATEGSIVFYPGQRRRIANLDETALSLDDTKGKQGGRPSTIFLCRHATAGSANGKQEWLLLYIDMWVHCCW